MVFLFSVHLSIGERAAISAASGNMPLDRLLLAVFIEGPGKIFPHNFSSFDCILSTPLNFLVSIFLRWLLHEIFSQDET